MRQLISRKDLERKKRINQLLIGIVLIGLMVLSTLGFAFSGRGDDDSIQVVEYKGVEYSRQGEQWYFNVQRMDFNTRYNPEEVSGINFFSSLTIQDYVNTPLYFVGDSGEHFFELERNLLNRFVLRTSFACLDESCEGNFPVKNCSVDKVVVFEEIDYEDESLESIIQEENCVFIKTSLSNQTRYTDAFLFDLLGIR